MNRYGYTVLPNGLRIVSERIPSFKSASLCIWIDAGSREDEDIQPGTAHMLEHMLFRGTENRTGEEINREIEGSGGELNAITSPEHICLYSGLMATNLEKNVALMADIIQHPKLDPKIFEKEKNVVYEEVKMHRENPEKHIFDALRETAWGCSELGRVETGTIEDVRGMSIEHLREYIERFFTTKNILISACGNVKHDALVSHVEKYFCNLSENEVVKRRKRPVFNSGEKHYTGGERQVHLGIGFESVPFTHQHIFSVKVLSMAIGGGTSSRLYNVIREKEGLCYTIFAHNQSYDDTGLLGIYSGTADKNLDYGKQRIVEELARIGEKGLSETEFKTAKNMLYGLFTRRLESTEARAFLIGEYALRLRRFVPFEEIYKMLDDVTLEDVNYTANRILNSTHACAIIKAPT